jgi:hypothetical protein
LILVDETQNPASGAGSCLGGFTCLGTNAAFARVNNGQAVSPYFTWSMQFPVDPTFKLTNKDGIIHWYTDGTTSVLYDVNKTSCSKPVLPCADFSLVTDPGGQLYVQVILHTSKNGYVKAF